MTYDPPKRAKCRPVSGTFLLVFSFIALMSSSVLGAGADRHAQLRPLVEKTYDWKTIHNRLGLRRDSLSIWSGSGHSVKRLQPLNKDLVSKQYQASISRLLDLDPNRTILREKDWQQIISKHQFGSYQMRNKNEQLEFVFKDSSLRLKQVRQFEEKARGTLARVLVKALKSKTATPKTLKQVTDKLAKQHPYFENPFNVELMIADTRALFPTLAKWDFGRGSSETSKATHKLPKEVQQVIEQVGYRAYAHSNVLFANHLYKDGVVMLDAMIAAGLNPKNSRFVTTPYPFDKGVRAQVDQRGVEVSHNPYSAKKTKQDLEQSIQYLLQRSSKNNAPILVFDDGGHATEVIAEKYADQLHRFRIIEITKAGERVAKEVLPPKLQVNLKNFRVLNRDQMAQMEKKFLSASSYDSISREKAALSWRRIASYLRTPSMQDQGTQNALDGRVFGFSHHTYSDSAYKREVMTPLYTEQVNSGTFSTIEKAGMKLNNKKVTILGGGAMGQSAGLELKSKGYTVTFVEPDKTTQGKLKEHGFSIRELKDSLKGRGLIMDMSGKKNLISMEHLFMMDEGTHIVNGSSKDYPFDMQTFRSIATKQVPWRSKPGGQRSASYVFNAAGLTKTLHFPGDGYTISHGGKKQNVPLKKFLPEINALFLLGVHALTDRPVTHYPFFSTPQHITDRLSQER